MDRHPCALFRPIPLAWAVLLLLLAATPAAGLRVVTYNIQGMRPDSNWQVRMYFIVQRLIELDPDIICLQEVCETLGGGGADNQARTIATALGSHFGQEYTWSFCQTHIGWDQFNEGVGLVSRHPVLASACRQLPTGTFPRKVAWHRVQTPLGEVQVLSTHLEHNDAQSAVRLQQAIQARNYALEKLAAHPGSVAILGGDFNATPQSAPVLAFTAAGPDSSFSDAWAGLHPSEDGFTMPAGAPTARIDYLFSRGGDQALSPDSCRLVFTATYDASHYPSDHYGVLAVYDLELAVPGGDRPRPEVPRLLPPHPNPFNPSTSLELELPAPTSAVRLAVVDLRGRELALLHDGPLAAGRHIFSWRPDGAAAGLYLAVLRQRDRSETARLLYLP
jgi:endonuclease/exonuclease/phosphatase family metal-dependent hydrolase